MLHLINTLLNKPSLEFQKSFMGFKFLSLSLINRTLYEQYQSYSVKFPRRKFNLFWPIVCLEFFSKLCHNVQVSKIILIFFIFYRLLLQKFVLRLHPKIEIVHRTIR